MPIIEDQSNEKARFAGPEKPKDKPTKPVAAAPKPATTDKPDDTAHDEIKDALREARKLLRRYMASHGDWRKIHVTTHEGSFHDDEFTRCGCDLCQDAAKFAGEPSAPNA